ncbi:FxsA family protein [Mycolicibacterium sp. 120270]|uniref:FxsA family protein n=1 Tax=Mycolicibacterium sp. 120270 TaxID=3090600 RepID=UPI00299D6447|nr:FxsA family protein [Mycolicibacterium sp. 120270]MDX1887531.1 FxsA family protein [Mycolicibacterium sp. 120270]
MAMRLFLIYLVVELAVVVALVSTIGFGWTVLALLGTSVLGFLLAGSQVKRHIQRLRSGLTSPQGAITDSAMVALGTVLVFVPGVVTTVAGLLLLTPPTRAVARPVLTAMAARRIPLITVATTAAGTRSTAGRGDYIDGEVIDVVDVDGVVVERPALPHKPD